jgi:hypothetical protein
MQNAVSKNIMIVEEAEKQGKRFCPNCGSKMRTCCDIYRQYNLTDHRVNCIHDGTEKWICINCGLIEYKELALRLMCGRAGSL